MKPLSFSKRAMRTAEAPINYLMHAALANPALISLAVGFVDQETLPVAAVRDAISELLSDPFQARQALQYGTTQGHVRLRELAVEHLEQLEGRAASELGLNPSHVVITTGSQQLLQLVSDVLIDPGDIVLMGAPDYFVFMSVLAALGARVIGVAMDHEGLVPEALEGTLARLGSAGQLDRVKLVYCASDYQNPSGVSLSDRRRPEILEIVRRWSRANRVFLLEDSAYRELYYTVQGPPSLRSLDREGETVILTQTFSKSFSPGIKIAATILPDGLLAPVLRQKGNHDFGSANFNQHLLASVIESGRYADHLQRLRSLYCEKAATTLKALSFEFGRQGISARWTTPAGGLYVWVTMPPALDTTAGSAFFKKCIERGVLYVPGEYCFPPELGGSDTEALGTPRHTMRLSFGVPPVNAIQEGIRRLAQAARECLDQ
jgi:2-aminoadipate transaminase